MARIGRKGKGTPADESVKQQLLALQAENDRLRDQLVNRAIFDSGAAVPLIDGPNDILDDTPVPTITAGGRREPDLGKVWMCRVLSDKAPPGVKIPDIVQMAGEKDRSGRPFKFSRKFFTDTPIELPEEREFQVETGSAIYEAALRRNMGPAEEDCRAMGFEEVRWRGTALTYVAFIRHYTVQKIAERQETLLVPA